MKAVKQISTGRIVYRESPEFAPGKGILNAATKGIPEADLEEAEITQAEWDIEMTMQANERKEAILNSSVNKALIEALEEAFPMGRGTFRAKWESKLP